MFWKAMNWLGDNWKSIVLLGIPVVISAILQLIRSNQSLRKKVELKEKENQIERDGEALEDKLKEQAEEARRNSIAKILEEHEATLSKLAEEERKQIESIDTPEEATEALRVKLAQMSIKPHEVRPPRFRDPRKTAKTRLCRCGSGLYYRHCHGKYWKAE